MKTLLEQAKGHEKTCDFLFSEGKGEHNDWVITTAFYAAMFYLEHKIFPIKSSKYNRGNRIENFDLYVKLLSTGLSRHKDFKRVVREECPPKISTAYRKLFSLCYDSRYVPRDMAEADVSLARTKLAEIKVYCV